MRRRRIVLNRAVGMAALAVVTTAASAASDVLCSSAHRGELDAAKQARIGGDPAQAMKASEAVLKDEPNNLRAHYTIGLAKMDLSVSAKGDARTQLMKAGFDELTRTANGTEEVLRKKDARAQDCLKEQAVFSVMNTLAYYYSGQKNLSKTEYYLKRSLAYDKLGLLNPDTKRKTLGNLGSFYYTVGDMAQAKTYLAQAVAAGNPNPALKAQLISLKSGK